MIKSKPCTEDGCNYPRFAKGFCGYHQYLRTDKKPKEKKKPKPIPHQSKVEKVRQTKYRPARLEYLSKHEMCECCDCTPADQIHHKRGRVGPLLWNQDYFLAVCGGCHHEIEVNPEWAKENGYSENRLSE